MLTRPEESARRARPDGASASGRSDGVATLEALLRGCRDGDRGSFDDLFTLLYDELRVIARHHLRELDDSSGTLNTTAVVHESYLKLADGAEPRWRERTQFFAVASKAMRHILVDRARRRGAEKRGGGMIPVALDDDTAGAVDRTVELLELDDALARLAARRPRLETIVECRFFGGMTVEETADALGVSPRTVEREWTRARAYLYRLMSAEAPASRS